MVAPVRVEYQSSDDLEDVSCSGNGGLYVDGQPLACYVAKLTASS